MMDFEFATSTRIVFGAGRASIVPAFLVEHGFTSVLLVTGRSAERARPMLQALTAAGIHHQHLAIRQEPSLDDARIGAQLCREHGVSAVLSVGGGSAIDAGKAIAALATNPGDVLDYVEVIGRAQPLRIAPLPFIALPTTAGTGAEVARNAVLGSKEHGVKVSLRSPQMLPRLAVIDPELLRDAPSYVLRDSGLDAFSQLTESYLSCRANPLTSALARDGLMRSVTSLKRAVLQGPSAEDRENLCVASLFGGLCLANAGLGAVHGFAAPIGGMFEAPHGAVCAALLPHVMRENLRALQARQPEGAGLARFRSLAVILTGRHDAAPEEAVAHVETLCAALKVPGLSAFGVTAEHLEELVGKAERASSMRGNPLPLTREELLRIAGASL
jgi:alcohol dehydrogenase class IV